MWHAQKTNNMVKTRSVLWSGNDIDPQPLEGQTRLSFFSLSLFLSFFLPAILLFALVHIPQFGIDKELDRLHSEFITKPWIVWVQRLDLLIPGYLWGHRRPKVCEINLENRLVPHFAGFLGRCLPDDGVFSDPKNGVAIGAILHSDSLLA